VTGGVGFRYELARDYGLHAGLDVAFGPDSAAIHPSSPLSKTT
jgi:hypothetical protein